MLSHESDRAAQPRSKLLTHLNVLLVEDDPGVSTPLRAVFATESVAVDVATDGPSGFEAASGATYDVIILDVELPRYDGFEILRRLRDAGSSVPVIMLTVRSQATDVVHGLREGADDYVAKPFNSSELLARVYAVHRRAQMASGKTLRFRDVQLDVVHRRAERAGERLRLTGTEFAILEALLATPDVVVTRRELLERVWGIRFEPGTNRVDVHVFRLRSKLEAGGRTRIIHSVRGQGFKMGD